MTNLPRIIKGESHTDERGTICFLNDFDMTDIKRIYQIIHPRTSVIRGWRGHKIERRWFNVNKGAFKVSLVKIDNWKQPNPNLTVDHFTLTATENSVLCVPAGYATSVQATQENSEVIVFADYGIEHAQNDDYLFPTDYFINNS